MSLECWISCQPCFLPSRKTIKASTCQQSESWTLLWGTLVLKWLQWPLFKLLYPGTLHQNFMS